MKKTTIILAVGFAALIIGLSACGSGGADVGSESPALSVTEDILASHENDAKHFAELYPVTQDNPYIFATYDEVISVLESGTGIIVFGFPDCPRCQNAFPVLEKAFYEMNLDKRAGYRGRILYYDIFDDRDAHNERYQTIVSYLEDHLTLDDSGNPRIYVPDIYFVAIGKIVGNHLDTVPSVEDPFADLTLEQEMELLGIYKDLIAKMEAACC